MKTNKGTPYRNCLKMILLVLGFLVLYSCDPMFWDNYILENRSDFEIKIFYSSYSTTDTTIIVSPNTSTNFFYGGGNIGCAEDYLGKEFLNAYFDSISFSVNDSIVINIEYLNRENWEFFAEDCDVANYKLIIENSDISSK